MISSPLSKKNLPKRFQEFITGFELDWSEWQDEDGDIHYDLSFFEDIDVGLYGETIFVYILYDQVYFYAKFPKLYKIMSGMYPQETALFFMDELVAFAMYLDSQ